MASLAELKKQYEKAEREAEKLRERIAMAEQAKGKTGELKQALAHTLTELYQIGELPDLVNVDAATGRNGVVNFYRALKVSKPKE